MCHHQLHHSHNFCSSSDYRIKLSVPGHVIQNGCAILASSGLHVEAMRARAERAGVRHFIPKPYTTETLLQALHEVLGEPPPHGVG